MYEVVQAFYVQEFGIALEVGVLFADGDLEPDVIAQLLSDGVIVDLNAPVVVEDKPAKKGKSE